MAPTALMVLLASTLLLPLAMARAGVRPAAPAVAAPPFEGNAAPPAVDSRSASAPPPTADDRTGRLASADEPAAAPSGDPGSTPAGLESFDREVGRLMDRWDLPGATLAVVRDGRLVMARGYGLADVESEAPVTPAHRFRLSSLSKTVTAVTVVKLAQEGRLGLDDPALPLLGDLAPADGPADPRWEDVTVRHLLQHTWGWNRDVSGDPTQPPLLFDVADVVGVDMPADCTAVTRWVLTQRLDFAPGTGYTYANPGYCVLGDIVERAAAGRYEDLVRRAIWEPVGARGAAIGRSRPADARADEVRYYDDAATTVRSVFPDDADRVARPYGGSYIEGRQPVGGWIATASDYARFLAGLAGRRGAPLLDDDSVNELFAPPDAPGIFGSGSHYALGWIVRQTADGFRWGHPAANWGASGYASHDSNGTGWVVLFNAAPDDADIGNYLADLEQSLWRAADAVEAWPTVDLFDAGG